MTVKEVYATVTNCSGILSITINQSYSQPSSYAEIEVVSHSLSIGDSISIDIGYSDNHQVVFTGTVESIVRSRGESTYIITAFDCIKRVVDYFMVSDDPQEPWSRSNIAAEDLVRDLLQETGFDTSKYSYTSPGFTFATQGDSIEFNLTKAIDAITTVCRITGYHFWGDENGYAYYKSRPQYPTASDSVAYDFSTGDAGEITAIEYSISAENLRNRVVVYGKSNTVKAVAQATSPYLPAGYYKTAVIAHDMIDTDAMAQNTANTNLEIMNRLTETISLTTLGVPSIRARQVVTITEPFTGLSTATKWLVYSVKHLIRNGYIMQMDLVK